MDSQSLDGCIQSTLSALYPPFEVTAATVLCQVFDVVEKTYRGDGLRYLIDFLIPAKHILQCVQQDACVQYCGFLFQHEGWPLCIHEKIIVQLASLDWRVLKPGDFYLQVVPYLKKSPRIVVKCLAKDRHNVEELVVPEVSYTSIFTIEWLNCINGGRMGAALENCLLATDDKIFRVPWEKIVNPEFIDKPKAMESDLHSDLVTESCSALSFSEEPLHSTSPEMGGQTSHGPNLLGSNLVTTATTEPSERAAGANDGVSLMLDEDSESDLEGEYVELSEVSLPRGEPQMGSLAPSERLTLTYCTKAQPRANCRLAAHQASGSCLQGGICLALTSMSHGQSDTTRTPDTQAGNTGICLENCPATGSEQSLLKIAEGSERNPTSTVAGTKEPSEGKQRAHSKHELDWRYAMCSYTDSEDPEWKLPTAGTLERTEVAWGSIAEEGSGGGESVCCLGVSGTEATLGRSRESAVLAEEDLLSVSDTGHLRLCCSCEGDSGLPENAFLQPTTFLVPPGHISNERVTDSHPLQELSSGVIDHCSEQRTGVPLPHGQVEEADPKPIVMLAKPGRDSGSKGQPQEMAQQSLVKQEKQNDCRDSLSVEGQVGGCPFPEEGQEKVHADQQQAEGALQLSTTSAAPGRPAAEQEEYSGHPPAETDVQTEGFSTSIGKEGTEACWVDNRSEQNPLLSETSMEVGGLECLTGQRDENSQNGSAREEPYMWTLAEAECKSASLKTPERLDPSEPGMEDAPSAPLTDESPGSVGHGSPGVMNGDQDAAPEALLVREASFKWAEKVSGEAGKPGLVPINPRCTWEESAVHAKHQNPPSLPPGGNLQTVPMAMKDVNLEVLQSGVACLPGTRDKSGRAVIIITMRNTVWLNPHCNTNELTRLLLYLRSILRPECQSLGLTILVDARRCSPVPALFKALAVLQDAVPHCIHAALLLVEKEVTFRMEKPASVQVELLTSIKSLHKHIDSAKLPLEFDGALPYCHLDWLRFRMRLERLLHGCQGASTFLAEALQAAETSALPDRAEEANALLKHYRQLMKTVLEDSRLVRLQLEGGALLARLRKEESCVTLTEDYRDALEAAATLYNRVDEGIHQLVRISNKRIEALELVMDFEAFEECSREVSSWIENVGQQRLTELTEMDDSLEVLLQAQKQFQDFELVADEYCQRGKEALGKMGRWEDVCSAELHAAYGIKLQMWRNQLMGFCSRLEASRSRIDWTAKLYEFFDQAYEWALEGMRQLASVSMEDCSSQELCSAALKCLENYKEQHPEISEARFQEAKELACQLRSSNGLKQWQFAWSKCQETKLAFDMKLEAALRTKRSPAPEGERGLPGQEGAVWGRVVTVAPSATQCLGRPSQPPGQAGENAQGQHEAVGPGKQVVLQDAAPSSSRSIPEAPKPPCGARDDKSTLESIAEALEASPACPSTPASRQLFPKRILRKAQSFDLACSESLRSSCQRTLSEPARYGNTGVFIKGLEVSSTELVDRTNVARQHPGPTNWAAGCAQEERRSGVSVPEAKSWGSKLRHIIDEMVTTEQEYVRSLHYIIESYFPEMERADLPQDLRGKRSVIFGNLEKLYDFHSQYFLRELESCCNHPLRVSHCFLRHKDQFGMYALYSKNKPKSDSLLASRGNTFFKFKQMQLGDKMDLASYLLKPIQRMSKYALLLKDLIKQCGEAQEQELVYLRAAEEMVRFQLRHGNDLLAMDAIRDCDVNLKEQGQLVRQDEFSVCLGRRKCQRHVFLFEDLILFSKPKRIEGGFDVYIYKRSFKTADIGLTENSGESGLRFEIWFRRRKSSDTHILQASSIETKQAWTSDITKILWEQAARNKEIRMQEMVSMGVGNKPFLDIKPSEAAIHDRAIDYIMKGRGARTRASIAVSLFDHVNPYKRSPAPLPASGPSSCSVLGPLNLHMYLDQAFLPNMLSTSRPFDSDACIEEDEMENETSSQPSMTTESSESSQCMSGSGSSSSDSGCVSSIPRDSFCEDLGSPLSTPASSSLASPLEEKSCFPKSQYVSAV
ncbi:puratrophin-1 [Eublepharis macularius]|uniref:Puratrophin-1 n=1 Tax=Eublepharis macularius TaxID=481883 RepID=A0AA97KI75_EUBMA|nr:puratrophin-1 [Eublepharis macularius]